MTIARSTAYIVLFLAALVVSTRPAAASDPNAEKEKVVETIRTMFASMSNDDVVLFREITAPDFYAFDMGKNMTSSQLIEVVKNARASGMTFSWQVTDPQVHIDGQMAWITYVNRGSILIGADKRDMTWLESAVLRKADDSWRIVFLHSSPASSE